MTEAEWQSATNPAEMLRSLTAEPGHRKRTLLACGCCRRKWFEISEPALRQRIALAERFADDVVTEEEVQQAFVAYRPTPTHHPVTRALRSATEYLGQRKHLSTLSETVEILLWLAEATGLDDTGGMKLRQPRRSKHFQRGRDRELAAQAVLVRDVLGNPFRQPALHPAWRTDTAVSLARTMYESRDFSAMPILADALQDAGCDSDAILNHCRGGEPHVRGCWVVDWVLGK